MKLIRFLHNLRPEHRHGVLTIGNYDGIHLGHQAMLSRLAELADRHATHSVLMSFTPLPHEHFAPASGFARLMNLREKVNTLTGLQVCPDYFLLARFNHALAELDADAFVEQILVEQLAIKAIVIGDDFRYGKGRSGDYHHLQQSGERHGFEVVALSTHNMDNMRVSSTRVRDALIADDFAEAERLLGRPYTIEGRVAHGDKLGRTIGFPTANIYLHRPDTALDGVYAVKLWTAAHGWIEGIANLGKRPTVNGTSKRLEVHLFDFSDDIYGEHVCISFHKKIRDEHKFDSFDDLKRQIVKDCVTARTYWDQPR